MLAGGQDVEPVAAVVYATRDEAAALAVEEGGAVSGVVGHVDGAALGEQAAVGVVMADLAQGPLGGYLVS